MKSNINLKENSVSFALNPKIYPKEVVFRASYVFIDRMYVYVDSPKRGGIIISLKGKEKMSFKQLEKIRGEFLNELLNSLVRENVTRRNKKILEYIMGGAIIAALEKPEQKKKKENEDEDMEKIEKEIAKLKRELEKEDNFHFQKDPLNIKKPYEEKRKNKKKRK
jgi:His-Xaa-Ser system protein HxsD